MPPRVKLANEVKEKYMAQYDDRKNLHKNRHKVFFCLPTCLAKPLWEKPFLSKYDFTTRTSGGDKKKKKREEDKNIERERARERHTSGITAEILYIQNVSTFTYSLQV